MFVRLLAAALLCSPILTPCRAQTVKSPVNGTRYPRLAIRNAMIIDGNGTPASGPKDIIVENNKIIAVIPLDAVAMQNGRGGKRMPADAEIDATGKYVLPGLINAHAHTQDERGGIPQPIDYELKIWLSCGITTVRDVGSDTKKTLALRAKSAAGEIAAPRFLVYPMFNAQQPVPTTPEQARARIREYKEMGADGVKFLGMYRDIMEAAEDEAHKLNLPIAHHVGVEETNAWDDIRFGTRSIEHWYGIPDAAIPDGVQNFPPNFNYNNETDRFRYAGHLWREADPKRLQEVLGAMVKANVAWVPTLDIYEASRDLQRAQNQPWFREYLHPTLEEYFRPNPRNHGSYFLGWTSNDEVFWKENYRIWMAALRDFERMGGTIGVGDDAGFIYQIYGFGLLRELELHEEAGFNPIKVIQHVTGNNAKILGMEGKIGGVRPGYFADLIVVNGNPLENMKVLYPTGVEAIKEGKQIHTGGIEWTIKDGYCYHVPTISAEVRQMVASARASQNHAVSAQN
ncbi:MAG TPA: amidohydrolase family protein [Bryobacteraceae bacterium]|jgi:cytosine/adenosine deaminase-related metal-dependent hydrolase|nr:amidohydrolase family protein [Bryobacteraceae bacterium]